MKVGPFASNRSDAVCFAWRLSEDTLLSPLLNIVILETLHEEIKNWAELLGLQLFETGAASGMLLREEGARPSGKKETEEFSAADRLVRFGQLLGRWAFSQGPFFQIQMGVHCGSVNKVHLPGEKHSYFGEAVSLASVLSATSVVDMCVMLSASVRKGLNVLQQLPFRVGAKHNSFQLDPDEEALPLAAATKSEERSGRGTCRLEKHASSVEMLTEYTKRQLSYAGTLAFDDVVCSTNFDLDHSDDMRKQGTGTSKPAVEDMSFDEFRDYLYDNGVDIWKYGKGSAKSLQDLYRSVVVDCTSRLVSTADGDLQLKMEVVRINLIASDSTGNKYHLRLLNEIDGEGRVTNRNQVLACKMPVTLSGSALERTQLVVSEFMETRLSLPLDAQRKGLILKQDTYREKEEETCPSPSTPDLMTAYVIHEIDVQVLDINCPGLDVIGLPSMKNLQINEKRAGNTTKNYGWRTLGEIREKGDGDALLSLLRSHGVDAETWEPGRFAELFDEVYESKYSTLLIPPEGVLERMINIVKVWFCCRIYGIEHVAIRTWPEVPSDSKMKPVTLRMQQKWEWQDAVGHALHERLGMSNDFIDDFICIDEETYRLYNELEISNSYPGLQTRYQIHEVKVHLVADNMSNMSFLGLPDGSSFTVTKRGKAKSCWSWVPMEIAKQRKGMAWNQPRTRSSSFVDVSTDPKLGSKRQLPTPKAHMFSDEILADVGGPCPALIKLLEGRKPDKDRARNAAKRIRDKHYTCRQFYEDCTAAFPELICYVYSEEASEAAMTSKSSLGGAATSSGRTGNEEYQRTLSALFAVYWLARLDLEGAKSFSFGVDREWNPLSEQNNSISRRPEETAQRQSFYESVNWKDFENLFIDAGILVFDPKTGVLSHDIDRTLAMLVLTAIHDIMKMSALLPIVQPSHDQWLGYQAGDTISDHDCALAYVLCHYGELLPSFAMLTRAQKKSIMFTQCKMEYNMGWLVQAEAPPGALFTTFKRLITQGGASPQDVAFYFVHWLTDLAGAEPYPQEGCEKFVLKFPRKVLGAFMSSFSTIRHLSDKTETQVFEDYLLWRWRTYEADQLGPAPTGAGTVAILRLIIMAQGASEQVLNAYRQLDVSDREVLNVELARTGCAEQSYACEQGVVQPGRGPVFLVYYAPALLQKAGTTDLVQTLQILTDVIRQSRILFPLSKERYADTVTVRIDQLKELQAAAILAPAELGDVWILRKTSEKDAEVMRGNLINDQIDQEQERILMANLFVKKRPSRPVGRPPGAPRSLPLPEYRAGKRLVTFKGDASKQNDSDRLETDTKCSFCTFGNLFTPKNTPKKLSL